MSISIPEKMMELLEPFFKELKIEDTTQVRDICNKMQGERELVKIISSNIIKEDLFEEMTSLCNKFKTHMISLNLKELQEVSLLDFNKACELLPKVFVYLSNVYTKTYYSFESGINDENEQYLIIYNKKSRDKLYQITGEPFRKFVSDIIKLMNNDIFMISEKFVTVRLDLYKIKNPYVYFDLNIDEMADIVNQYTTTVNMKLEKRQKKEFKLKTDGDYNEAAEDDNNNDYSRIISINKDNPYLKYIEKYNNQYIPINFDQMSSLLDYNPHTNENTVTKEQDPDDGDDQFTVL